MASASASATATATKPASDSASAEVTATRLTPHIGAVVSGIDLTDTGPDNIARINELLLEHGVLFFRGAALSADEQEALARGFGEPSMFPLSKLMRSPDFTPPIMGEIIDNDISKPDADGWHTDITWIEEPPKIAFLQAIEVPERGGDTLWADCYAAYDALSPVMRECVDELVVNHQVSKTIVDAARYRGGEELANMLLEKFPPVQHPLVRTHPETGRKALFVGGEFMIGIEGMHDNESRLLLDWLREHINNPNFQVRWQWTAGDLAVWDERCTNHRALSNHYPSYRHMRRCTVDGDKPF